MSKSKLEEMVEYMENYEDFDGTHLEFKLLDKARQLLADEQAHKPPTDLWEQHKAMIKLAQDHGLHLAANWAVNMSGRTFSEAKDNSAKPNNQATAPVKKTIE